MEKLTIKVVVNDLCGINQTTNIGNIMDYYIDNRYEFGDYFKLKFMYEGRDITSHVIIHSIVPRHLNIDSNKLFIHFDDVVVMYRVLKLND